MSLYRGLRIAAAAACALAPAAAFAEATQAELRSGLSAAELFQLADQARDRGRTAQAEAMYDALANDPDLDVRTEARFRKGLMLAAAGRYRDAAVTFRRLLDEKPDATPVRLELARVLLAMNDEAGARKALRQAQAAGLPPEVATVVDQFANALTSRQNLGGSIALSLAPDSNINRATSAKTLDTVIAPLNLDREAQAQSGLGLKASGQAFGRRRLTRRMSVLAQISGAASLYRQSEFDDVSTSFLIGPEIQAGPDRWRPAIGLTRRFYGGNLYASTQTATVDWLHPAGRRAQLSGDLTWSKARYRLNALQDGQIVDVGLTYQRAFSARTGGSLTLSAGRQGARDPGYATTSGGVGALVWRDKGRQTVFASANFNALNADERLFPFRDRRQDRLYRFAVGAAMRQYSVRGFAPAVRLVEERNISTLGIYDYSRTSVEVGVERAF